MATDYPFWARWVKNGSPDSDITSVNYDILEYNPATDEFDISNGSGTISSSDADGRWVVEYSIPNASGHKKYVCEFTPVGSSTASVLNDEIDVIDGELGGGGTGGSGTETHTGTVCDPDGNPLEGVAVRAVPYGTTFTFASDTTDSNGNYELTGLNANHAYEIHFNKDGYWAKQSGRVIP